MNQCRVLQKGSGVVFGECVFHVGTLGINVVFRSAKARTFAERKTTLSVVDRKRLPTPHAFRNQQGEYARWNDGFGRDIFGQRWITHHGGRSTTAVSPAATPHPVLRGVEPFTGRSWLYHVTPLQGEDVQTLLMGRSIGSNHPEDGPYPHVQPVAWTKTYTGDTGRTARVFFTTLGHPEEFADVNMRRLVVNGLLWALGREADIPEDGAKADLVGQYDPPGTQ
jgi:uncharacterized protein